MVWAKSCGQDAIRIFSSLNSIASMYSLQIKESNSILKMPLMYADGQYLESTKLIPQNMDQMYIKIEATSPTIVNWLIIILVLFGTSIYQEPVLSSIFDVPSFKRKCRIWWGYFSNSY